MDYQNTATWRYLMLSFEGRIGRAAFWIAGIALTFISVSGQYMALMLDGEKLAAIVWLLFLYPTLAITIKRLHDRDRPNATIIMLYGPAFALTLLDMLDIDTGDDGMSLSALLQLMVMASSLWLFIDLGCLRGTRGPNAHGPDPVAKD